RFDPQLVNHFTREGLFDVAPDKKSSAKTTWSLDRSRCAESRQRDIGTDGKFEDQPLRLAFLRHESESGANGGERRVEAKGLAINAHAAGHGGVEPKQRMQKFRTTGTDQAREANNLTRADNKVQGVTRMGRCSQVFDLKHRLAYWATASLIKLGEIPPYHETHHFVVRDLAARQFARVASIAQNEDTIGNCVHLGQAMRNIDDAHAIGAQPANDTEKMLGFMRGEAGGW